MNDGREAQVGEVESKGCRGQPEGIRRGAARRR